MKKSLYAGRILVALVPFLAAGAEVQAALANRVFVAAKSGNDLNACAGVATPCQTFVGALTQVAAGGEVIVLESGGYGAATITQGVTIEAPPGVVAFIHPAAGDAITIAAGPTDIVVLRGLVLNGGVSNGITVTTVGFLYLENCVISGFSNRALHFHSAGQLLVKDTSVRNNTVGIYVDPLSGNAQASLDHCRVEGNAFGVYCSVAGGATASSTIRDSVISANPNTGMAGEVRSGAGPAELNVENCLVANNGIGIASILSSGSVTVRVSGSTVTGNATGVANFGGNLLSRFNNTVQGNTSNGSFSGGYAAD